MDVRMPDGTIVQNVPDTMSQAELLKRYQGYSTNTQSADAYNANRKPDAVAIDDATGQRTPYDSDVPLPPGMRFDPASLPTNKASTSSAPARTLTEKLFGVPQGYDSNEPNRKVLPGAEPLLWLEKNPDVALATLGSVLAPELSMVPRAASGLASMPFIKQLMIKASEPFIRQSPAILAATVGGGAGGAIKEATRPGEASGAGPTGQSILDAAAQSAKDMGLSELTGIGLVSGMSKLLAPNAGKLTENFDSLTQFARENKLPLRPSAVTTGKMAGAVENAANIGVPGRVANQFADKKIAKQLETTLPEANNLISKTIEVEGKNAPGVPQMSTSLREGLEAALAKTGDASVATKVDTKYKSFVDAIGGKTRITDYSNIKSAMRDIEVAERKLAGGADEGTLEFIKSFKEKHADGISAHDLYQQYKRLNRVDGESRNLGALRDVFKQEFEKLGAETGESALNLLGEAHKSSALFNKYLKNNNTIKGIISGTVPEEHITVRLFSGTPESTNTLKYLRAQIPKDTFNELLTQNLANMIKNNSKTPTNATFARYLDGAGLEKLLNKNRKQMEALYPAETVKALDNLAAYAKANAGAVKNANQSWMETLAAPSAVAGSVGGIKHLMGSDPTGAGLIIPEVGSYFVARSLMKPDGALFNWLTKGRNVAEPVKQGLKLGGREIFQSDGSE